MNDYQKDYLWLGLAFTPLWAGTLALVAVLSGQTYIAIFLGAMAGSSSIGCVRLLNDFWRHGIHNDR